MTTGAYRIKNFLKDLGLAAPSRTPEAISRTTLRIWGCRGSIPAPGADSARYGGDTTCFECTASDGELLVFDGGTGLRRLGESWAERAPRPATLNILLSHLHLDHIFGLGFFKPLLSGEVAVRLWTTMDPSAVEAALRVVFAPPFLPFDLMSEKPISVLGLPSAETKIGPFAATPVPLNHPGGCTGYAITVDGKRLTMICDHEHGDPAFDAAVEEAARGADLLVYDAPYTDAQYESHRGWGHSTYSAAAALARKAEAKRLLIVHHAPASDDASLDRIAADMASNTPPTSLARDGDCFEI